MVFKKITEIKLFKNFIPLTSANKHDIILSILCLHPVHHYLCELIVNIGFDYDWTVVDGEHRVVHGWMASGKCDNIVRKVLC